MKLQDSTGYAIILFLGSDTEQVIPLTSSQTRDSAILDLCTYLRRRFTNYMPRIVSVKWYPPWDGAKLVPISATKLNTILRTH